MQRWVIISALQGRRLTPLRSRVARFTRLRGTSDFFLPPISFSFQLCFQPHESYQTASADSFIKNSLFFPPRSHFYKGTFSPTLGHSDKWQQPLYVSLLVRTDLVCAQTGTQKLTRKIKKRNKQNWKKLGNSAVETKQPLLSCCEGQVNNQQRKKNTFLSCEVRNKRQSGDIFVISYFVFSCVDIREGGRGWRHSQV